MTAWEGWTTNGAYGMRIEARVRNALDRMCSDAGSVETGGILVGHYSSDRSLATVQEATPPPSDSKRGRSWFNRGVSGLHEMLARRWRARDRTHYLGEWHFHPAVDVVPSAEDFKQMIQIANAHEYKCREPLLVICGAGKVAGTRLLRAFVCPAGTAPMELIANDLRAIEAVPSPRD